MADDMRCFLFSTGTLLGKNQTAALNEVFVAEWLPLSIHNRAVHRDGLANLGPITPEGSDVG